MATHPPILYNSTLAAAIDAHAITIYTAASTGFAVGKNLVIGNEVLLLTKVDTTNHVHEVKRGMRGTAAVKHVSGAKVWLGAPDKFGPNTKNGVEIAGYEGDLGVPKLPIGSRYIDPDTGYEYLLVDCGQAFVKGTWVCVDPDGGAILLSGITKGRVGLVVEAVSTSDKYAWVMVVGSFASACMTCTVTTDVLLAANAATPGSVIAASTCSGCDVIVHNASCTADVTSGATGTCAITGTWYGTAYLSNPWVSGVEDVVS